MVRIIDGCATEQRGLVDNDTVAFLAQFIDGMVNFSPAVKRMLLSLRTEKNRFSEMLISSPNGDAVV
ncbi:hypothetical protein, partial [Mycetohabitans sp. B6]|uniref:hypothetical protein n=1 Tax=Mycetohabitans sp. B6 TaxID=2841843 RepID=UPI001F2FBA24